jgi:hypothetical protein
MTSNKAEQEERRRVILQDQSARQGLTFKDFADAEFQIGSELGRFRGLSRETQVIGKSVISYPRLPSNSPWSSPLPCEEPLINATDCGDQLGYPIDGNEPATPAPTPAQALGAVRIAPAPPALSSSSRSRAGGATTFRRRI